MLQSCLIRAWVSGYILDPKPLNSKLESPTGRLESLLLPLHLHHLKMKFRKMGIGFTVFRVWGFKVWTLSAEVKAKGSGLGCVKGLRF